jgi:hypothetical protein
MQYFVKYGIHIYKPLHIKHLFMKRIVYSTLCIAFAVLTFTGCKKGNDDKGSYYIKGKKDGTAFTYSANPMALITNFGAGAGISVAFTANAQPNAASLEGLALSINFSDGIQPAVGTYSEDYAGTDYVAAAVYNPNSTTIVWAAGIHFPTVKPLKITITSMTADEMTGTFEGAFYKQDVSIPAFYDDVTLFTEGEFKLPVQ